ASSDTEDTREETRKSAGGAQYQRQESQFAHEGCLRLPVKKSSCRCVGGQSLRPDRLGSSGRVERERASARASRGTCECTRIGRGPEPTHAVTDGCGWESRAAAGRSEHDPETVADASEKIMLRNQRGESTMRLC